LIDAGIRAEKGFDNEKLGFKIRQAQMQKIPYMLVIGDREWKRDTFPPANGTAKIWGPWALTPLLP